MASLGGFGSSPEMAPRKQRFGAAGRARIGETHRRASAEAKYGKDYYSQGFRPEKEKGGAFLARQRQAEVAGPFSAGRSWNLEWRNGVPYVKARARQTDRIKEYGSDWNRAEDVLNPGQYRAMMRTDLRSPTASQTARNRGAFFEQNPDADMSHWQAYKFAQGLPIDPATGMRQLRSGELRDEYGRRVGDEATPSTSYKTGAQLFGGAGGSGGTGQPASQPLGNSFGATGWEDMFDRLFGNAGYRASGVPSDQYGGQWPADWYGNWTPSWLTPSGA